MFNFLKKKDICDTCSSNNCCNRVPKKYGRTVGVTINHCGETITKYYQLCCSKYMQELNKEVFNNG